MLGAFNYTTGVSVSGAVPNLFSITIENGAITAFGFGVWAQASGSLTNIDINNLSIGLAITPAGDGTCVLFGGVSSSTISNCRFNTADFGIRDAASLGGNHYNNISSSNMTPLIVTPGNNLPPVIIEDCRFAAPTN